MTNVRYPIEDYRDIETLNLYQERLSAGYPVESIMESIYAKSRDNARTPMQWSAGTNAGFTTGEPWMRLNPNHTRINAESQLQDEDSVYRYYQRLIALRKQYPVVADGRYELLCPDDPDVFAYKRSTGSETLTVVCNFHGGTAPNPCANTAAKCLISNYSTAPGATLRPYESFWYLHK